MANYWYVSSGVGTRSPALATPYTSAQTGSFTSLGASNVYALIADVVVHASFTSGDYVVISDAHYELLTSNFAFAPDLDGTTLVYYFVSVSEAACQTYTKATFPQMESTANWTPFLRGSQFHGIWFKSNDNYSALGSSTTNFTQSHLYECTIELTSTSRIFGGNALSNYVTFDRCDIICSHASGFTTIINSAQAGSEYEIRNCNFVITNPTGPLITASRPSISKTVNCDLSMFPTLINLNLVNYSVLEQYHRFDNCKLHPSVTYLPNVPVSGQFRIEAYNCTSATNLHPDQFYIQDIVGVAESIVDDGTTFPVRTDGHDLAYEPGKYLTAKVITNANCSIGAPFDFGMPASQWAPLSTATKTIRLHLTSDTVLYEQDVVVTVGYRKSSDISLTDSVNSLTTHNPLVRSILLTNSTTTWANPGTNEYHIDVTVPDGIDQVPLLGISIRTPATIYFDTEYEVI